MLKSILLIVFLLYVVSTSAQSISDSLYRPDIYRFLVEQSRQYSQFENDIVFLGNSITFWGNWTEMLDNHIIDLYKYFVDSNGKLESAYTWDGVHLTSDGYRLWVDILNENGCLPAGQKLTSTN